MKTKLLILIAFFLIENAFSQFGSQQNISTNANGARFVFSVDIDGDGDMDVLSASDFDDKIAWYENTDGKGNFSSQKIITTDTDGAKSVYATDIDGDGDMDVVSVSNTTALTNDKLAWYENTDGKGNFGSQQILPTTTTPTSVYAADIDNDGDMDLISSAQRFDRISWLENTDGNGTFEYTEISTDADRAQSVFSEDIDGDGDMDILSASFGDDKIAWYENTDGLGNFGSQIVISIDADGATSVYAVDLDGDGDVDVISASDNDDKIAWYENTNGLGNFSSQQIITTNAKRAQSVYSVDIDSDGDMDVLSASADDDKIAWYENTDGQGNFSSQQIITTNADLAWCVYAVDIDGDGKMDVLSASFYDDKIAWYKNTISTITETYVPDDNFEMALIDLGFDSLPLDDYIPTANINTITSLDVSNKSIADLTGIEDFAALQILTCKDNLLTNLDMKDNSSLIVLDAKNNQLTSLNVTQNTILQGLYIHENSLAGIDVANNLNLKVLNCSKNQLTGLDITNNTKLENLFCNTNQIPNLDVTQNTILIDLYCGDNLLTSLDVTKNTNLLRLSCVVNQITSLNVTQNTALTDLLFTDNQISSIDVTKNINLNQLGTGINPLGNLDVTKNLDLEILGCYENQLSSLDVTKNTKLERLFCYLNEIEELDVTNNPDLARFWLYGNQLTKLDVSNNTALESFQPGANNIESLDLSNNTAITFINAGASPMLTYLNIKNGNNSIITDFRVSNTPILNCIVVDDKNYSTTNWTDIDAHTSFGNTESECQTLAIEDFAIEGFKMYPNPVKDKLTIIGENMVVDEVIVFDHTGRMIRKIHWDGNSADLNNLASGMYILRIKTDQGTTARKMLKI